MLSFSKICVLQQIPIVPPQIYIYNVLLLYMFLPIWPRTQIDFRKNLLQFSVISHLNVVSLNVGMWMSSKSFQGVWLRGTHTHEHTHTEYIDFRFFFLFFQLRLIYPSKKKKR